MSYKEAMEIENTIGLKGLSSSGDSSCEIKDSSCSDCDTREIPSVCEMATDKI